MEIRGETITMNGFRLIGASRGACTVCDQDVQTVLEHPGRRRTRLVIGVHGPRGARCPGSRQPGKPYFAACHLPAWDDLSDHDKGQALAFEWKCHWERSFAYARENYPPVFEHPQLREVAEIPSSDGYVGGGYYVCLYTSSVVSSLGEQLEQIPNPWAGTGGFLLHPEPATIHEPLYFMAQRVLGEDEVARLQDLALAASR